MTTERLHIILGKIPPYIFSILCTAAICWLTIAPHPLGDNELPLFPGADKICHAIMFGGLTWCLLFDTQRRHWELPSKRIYIRAICASIIFGMAIEWIQRLTDMGRSYDPLDAWADAFGAICFGLIYIPIARRLNR